LPHRKSLRVQLAQLAEGTDEAGAQSTRMGLNPGEASPAPSLLGAAAGDVASHLPVPRDPKVLLLLPRALSTVLALLLLIPCLGIPFQDQTSLVQFHNRTLREWPNVRQLIAEPTQYFQRAREWLSDRAFPIREATIFQRNLLFYIFDVPPQKNVSIGRDGFIFYNGANRGNVNRILQDTCLRSHSPEISSLLQNALASFASFAERKRIAIDVVLVPTPATLYGDFLPRSVPESYRVACRERTAGRTPLLAITQPMPVHFVYPLLEMLEPRLQEGFFPKGNWHPMGLSQKVLRDTYLHRLGLDAQVDETLMKTTAPGEILRNFAIEKRVPVYDAVYPSVVADVEKDVALTKSTAEFFPQSEPSGYPFRPRAFKNRRPVLEESTLMVSDSYGFVAAPAFAAIFREFVQVMTNDMSQERVPELIDRIERLTHLNRIIMLVQEGDVEWMIGQWSQSLKAAGLTEIRPTP
jgi:hypothetical protein